MAIRMRVIIDDILLRTLTTMQSAGVCAYEVMLLAREYFCSFLIDSV